MIQDAELLSMYVKQSSEEAFAELVHRYLPLVHSAALRQTHGNAELAKDIAQNVFIDLARKAGRLRKGPPLTGWLYVSTRLASLKALRGIDRRLVREKAALDMQTLAADADGDGLVDLGILLDDAMESLDSEQREALLLRFFQGKELKDVGAALAITEDAARMRINRSLSKLHSILTSRGMSLSAEALAAKLVKDAVSAVPAGLATYISTSALSSISLVTGTQTSLFNVLAASKLQAGIVAVLVVAGVVTPCLVHYDAQTRLAEIRKELADRGIALELANAENERLQSRLEKSKASVASSAAQFGELLRVKGEVARLRRQLMETAGAGSSLKTQQGTPSGAVETSVSPQGARTNIVVRFVGPKIVDEEVIRTNISIVPNALGDQEAIDRDVSSIYATGYFSDVKAVEETNRSGSFLVYLVKCRPQLASISFAGNTMFSEQELLKQISSQPGKPLEEGAVFRDGQAIERSYKESGHQGTSVETLQGIDERTGSSTVVFKITESP